MPINDDSPNPEEAIIKVLEYYGADLRSTPNIGWQSIRCPFHNDRIASGRINIGLDAFKCHACGMSGDAIKLVKLRENLDTREAAVEFTRKMVGASIEDISSATPRRNRKKRKALGRHRWRKILE